MNLISDSRTTHHNQKRTKGFQRAGFLKLRHNFDFFQINSDKLNACVSIIELRGLEVCDIFNCTTIVGAIGKLVKTMLSRLLQIAIS